MQAPQILGVATGKEGNNYHLRVFVEKDSSISIVSEISEEFKVDSTDIRIFEIDEFIAANEPIKTRVRPAPIGSSISHFESSPGTLGCLVSDNDGKYILSNNHVLAKENEGLVGDPIIQPGTSDGGTSATDVIAKLSRFHPLSFSEPNQVDVAIAEILDQSDLVNALPNSIPFIGKLAGVKSAAIGMVVAKYGRSTGFRLGTIHSLNAKASVRLSTGKIVFVDQLEIVGSSGNFAELGDSGSVVVEISSKKVVGMICAISLSNHTLANHFSKVLEQLEVTLLI